MQPITKTIYQAFDGSEHETEGAARTHEKEFAHLAIVGLTVEEALAIANREDVERADAVERIGLAIGRKRLEAGERRRAPNKPKAPEPAAQPEAPFGGTIPITTPGQPWPPVSEADDAGSEADALTA